MSENAWMIIFGFAVVITAFWLPSFLAKRIDHGEARFDKDGKMIEDE